MTKEDLLLLNDLKANMQQLFKEFNRLENEKKLLEEMILSQKNEIEKLEQEKSELGRKNGQLKVASQILSGNDENGDAKQKIFFLVREIDKCIALLNK
jgi:predicted nuclease with TOPRIM domain